MTKKELIEAIAVKAEASKAEVERIVAATFSVIVDSAKNDTVKVDGFGNFKVNEKAARVGINPLTKEKVNIPAKKVLVFKPASALKDIK